MRRNKNPTVCSPLRISSKPRLSRFSCRHVWNFCLMITFQGQSYPCLAPDRCGAFVLMLTFKDLLKAEGVQIWLQTGVEEVLPELVFLLVHAAQVVLKRLTDLLLHFSCLPLLCKKYRLQPITVPLANMYNQSQTL